MRINHDLESNEVSVASERPARLGNLHEPAGYVDGGNRYQYVKGNPINSVDPLGLETEKEKEQILWKNQEKSAQSSFDYWNNFLNLQMGPNNDKPLNDEAKKNYMFIIRAVSWVESKHGTAGQNQPGRDPMQAGNPNDQWWKTITGQLGQGDRFVGGPEKNNYWANELATAVNPTFFPKEGHNSDKFTSDMSYFWAVPYLLHKINTKANGKTYKCGIITMDDLIAGAVAYNGGGDPKYKSKIEEALNLIK